MVPNAFRIERCVDPGAIVDDASFTVQDIDTAPNGEKYDYLTVVCYIGATDIAMAALKVQESDDDSTYTDISGLDYTGSFPSATDDNKFFTFDIDLRNKKRYIRLVATAGNGTTGTYMTAFGILGWGTSTPVSTTQRNVAATLSA